MKKRSVSGSVTVEAAIALPIFLCVIFSIIFFIKIVRTQEIIQHAIYQSALELSTVSYVFHASGLEAVHDSAQGGINDNSQIFSKHAGVILDSLNDLQQFTGNTSKASSNSTVLGSKDEISNIMGKYDDITGIVKEIANDPQKEFKAIACFIAGGYFEDMKTEVCVPLVKLYMGKYIPGESKNNMDARLRALGIKNGISGLDFSHSRFLEDNSENIEIIVSYRMNLPIPFKFFSDLLIVQGVTVRAWLGGDDTSGDNNKTQYDIWSLSNFERGRKIRGIFGANLPDSFPVISKFKEGTATLIKSVDLTAESYKDIANTQETIYSYISKLAGFKGQNVPWGSKEIVIKGSDIVSRELLLVIPQNTLEQGNEKILSACSSYAAARGVILKIERYGMKKTEAK